MNKTPTQGREFIHEIENMFFDIQNTEVIFFQHTLVYLILP